jgi:hypothetical protein
MMPTAKSIRVQVSLYEGLGFHEAFRRLGYPSRDIFVAMHEAAELDGGVVPWCILKSVLLPRPVLMTLSSEGFTKEEQVEFQELWPKIATAWNQTMTPEERERIWRESYVANNAGVFTAKMIDLGHRSIDAGTFV